MIIDNTNFKVTTSPPPDDDIFPDTATNSYDGSTSQECEVMEVPVDSD